MIAPTIPPPICSSYRNKRVGTECDDFSQSGDFFGLITPATNMKSTIAAKSTNQIVPMISMIAPRLVTADCRSISVYEISKLGGFKRSMNFALRGIHTYPDHITIRSLKNPDSPPQVILIDKRSITYGLKHFSFARAAKPSAPSFISTDCRLTVVSVLIFDLHRSGNAAAPDCGSRPIKSAPHLAMKRGNPAIYYPPGNI